MTPANFPCWLGNRAERLAESADAFVAALGRATQPAAEAVE